MTIASLRGCPLRIPFRETFRHASARRSETSSLWVEARSTDGVVGYGESCPRPYVTDETLDSALTFLEAQVDPVREAVHDAASLRHWTTVHAPEIDAHPAAWCAMELALWDLLGRASGRPVESLLGLGPLAGRFRYSAVLGDADPRQFASGLTRYRAAGFTDFKVKLSGDPVRDRTKFDALREVDGHLRVRVDANNLWRDPMAAIAALQAIEHPLFAVEEPVEPGRYAALARISEALRTRIVLDESFVRVSQLDQLPSPAETWILNVRVSKMGGLYRSLAVVEAARAAGLGLIVGAQVGETSLLTRAGLTVAHAARDLLAGQEGAFGTHLLRRDVCEPPLMFGPGGLLDVGDRPELTGPGLGLTIDLTNGQGEGGAGGD